MGDCICAIGRCEKDGLAMNVTARNANNWMPAWNHYVMNYRKKYDAYLFATGMPNRVIIESTLSTSPARDAGNSTGDNVIRYNHIRIYTWADLRNATTQCPTDSMVKVELERKGQR